jgi:esterase
MKLHFRKLGAGSPMIIMHGVFGTSDNWFSVSKLFAGTHEVFLLDLRNHGLSPHSDEFGYEAMSNDLNEFITDHQLTNPIVIGHSMGGKVAMQYAAVYHNLSKLIVVDIAPKYYPRHHDEILNALNALPLATIQSRGAADEWLQQYISELGVRQFLLKNLYRTDEGKFDWRMNLPVITAEIDIVGEPLDPDTRIDVPTLFVKGSKSNYILPEDELLIRKLFTNASIVTVEGAGHWVQAEQPQLFFEKVMEFLG